MPAPDFLCIGAQKAGTSWFDIMLRQHPQVFLPPMKEVHFFDFIHLPEHRPWIPGSFERHRRRLQGRDAATDAYFERLAAIPQRQDAWYAVVFRHPDAEGRVSGEVTPAYSLLPPEGIARVRAVNPATRIASSSAIPSTGRCRICGWRRTGASTTASSRTGSRTRRT